MKILELLEKNFFIIASVAHLSVILVTIKGYKDHSKLFYLIGHSLIYSAMMIRIMKKYRGKLYPSISGSIGHTLLLVYFIRSLVTQNKSGMDQLITIICILGQIGMVMVYWSEYIESNTNTDDGEKEYIRLNKMISFLLLLIFYSYGIFVNNGILYMIVNIIVSFAYLTAFLKAKTE